MSYSKREILNKFFENKNIDAADSDELLNVQEIVGGFKVDDFSDLDLREILSADGEKSYRVLKNRMLKLDKFIADVANSEPGLPTMMPTIVDLLRAFNKEKLSGMKLDRKDIESICNELINPVEKALVMGSFEGIKGYTWDDFLQLELKHIDQENNLVYLPARKTSIQVSESLKNYLVDSCNADSWISHSGSTLPYPEGDLHVIKRIRRKINESNNEAEPYNAYYIFKNSLKYLGISNNVTLRTVWRSGIIDFLGSDSWDGFINDFNNNKTQLKNQFDLSPSAMTSNKGLIFKKYFN